MKIAVVHEWLASYAGSERVLEQILHCYPQAEFFCVADFLGLDQRKFLQGKPVKSTIVQKLPFAKKKYRAYLPLMPWAIGRLDLSDYDLILSSSHAVAKGVKVRPDQLHISYIHSPMRYAWQLQEQYLSETGLDRGIKGRIVRNILKRIRNWDAQNTSRVQYLIANSGYIAQRIQSCYGRDSDVIYPPVNTDSFSYQTPKEDYYITVSRMVPYKKVDLIAEAFSGMPGKKLIIVGDGPDFMKVKKKAGSNVQMVGALAFSELKAVLEKAKAFVFAAEEDFGISVVEAQAAGTPVIAFGKGGALETVQGLGISSEPTGIFFQEQSVASLQESVRQFEVNISKFTPENCRRNAERFSMSRFREEYSVYVNSRWKEFQTSRDSSPS